MFYLMIILFLFSRSPEISRRIKTNEKKNKNITKMMNCCKRTGNSWEKMEFVDILDDAYEWYNLNKVVLIYELNVFEKFHHTFYTQRQDIMLEFLVRLRNAELMRFST